MNHEQRTTINEPRTDVRTWSFDRKVNLSVLVQLVILASLIVGSWVNLQRQLDSLQRDVTMLLDSNKGLQDRLETVSARSISYEYRLRALEKHVNGAKGADGAI